MCVVQKVLGRRSPIIIKEVLPVTVGLLRSFAVFQPVNGKGNLFNKVLPRLND